MKKSGFSLAEVLVTVAIIAIGAALLAPAYMNVKPDRYKFKVLNCYKALNKVTEDLLNNPDLYHRTPIPEDMPENEFSNLYIDVNGTEILDPDTEYGCNGLACTQQPTSGPDEFREARYEGFTKYPSLLLDFMHLKSANGGAPNYCTQNCSNGSPATGISSNNISWTIWAEPDPDNPSNNFSMGTIYRIIVDMNLNEGPNCTYGQVGSQGDSCQHPDRFRFIVDTSGDVMGGDPLTQQYLRNMTNVEKQVDYEAVQGG